jgi:cyclopropane fatty-acyl-phospholipid synthase-like methyltransferase
MGPCSKLFSELSLFIKNSQTLLTEIHRKQLHTCQQGTKLTKTSSYLITNKWNIHWNQKQKRNIIEMRKQEVSERWRLKMRNCTREFVEKSPLII